MGVPIARPLIGEDEMEAVQGVLRTGQIAAGPVVAAFEETWAEACGVSHAVACSNGTTALHACLEAMGVGPGDEVIVPDFTFVATANAVLYAGARPVLVDVDPTTFTLDTSLLEAALTERTKAVLPVHLYGQPADMDGVSRFAREHGLLVLGDAAQAHGASTRGRRVGSLGDAETFSFYPTKNITSGEGGMITTDDAGIAQRARSIINHGRSLPAAATYEHVRRGHNFRMTDIHAAIGLAQAQRLPGLNARRQEIAGRYDEELAGLRTMTTPAVGKDAVHVYHQYTLLCDDRAAVVEHLKAKGIGWGIYYPRPLHAHEHLASFGHGPLDHATRLASDVLSIPVHPGLSDADVEAVIHAVQQADARAATTR